MTSFGRRSNNGHSYIMNQQIALPVPYSNGDAHDFGGNGSGSFNFHQSPYNSYGAQFSSPYTQPSSLSTSTQHFASHYSSGHSTPDQVRLQHQPPQYITQSRYLQSPRYLPLRDALNETEIENQDSANESAMLSEPVVPPLDGFPDVREFDQLMKSYVDDLSVKKQDKALIHARRARNIRTVLIDPKDTAIESAQFRFWVKKMFKLQAVGIGNPDCAKMICHEGKPVAIREKLFKILTKAHQQCQHGGRDKTSAQVRRIYSWVPKELISRFVKICPTCQVRRGGSRLTPPNSRRGSPRLELLTRSPKLLSPPISRRDSAFGGPLSLGKSPQPDYLGQFDDHNAWVDGGHHQTLHGRSGINPGHVRSFGTGSLGSLPNSISATLDSFSGDLPVPSSHISYGSGFHGSSGHREF